MCLTSENLKLQHLVLQVTRKLSMSVEHCHKNIERLLLPVAIFSKYCSCQENSS